MIGREQSARKIRDKQKPFFEILWNFDSMLKDELLFRKKSPRLSHRDETEPKCEHGNEHGENFNDLREPTDPGKRGVVDSKTNSQRIGDIEKN